MKTLQADWQTLCADYQRACSVAHALGAVSVGPTPRVAVWSRDRMTLWRYGPEIPSRGRTPLLIVYSLVNRPYLLDLERDRSLIGALVEAGHTVFLIDWGTPGYADRSLTLSDYIVRYLGGSVTQLLQATGCREFDLLGVCQGGTFALCHAALEPKAVRRLITMVTPVDFGVPGDTLAAYAREIDIDRLVAAYGNVPGEFLRLAFQSLKPLGNTAGKVLALAETGGDAARVATHLRMERWISDSPDQAGVAFEEFVRRFYRDNALARGELVLDGRAVDLRRLEMPILNIYATRDHLVPPSSSQALQHLTSSRDYHAVAFDSGHIGVYVGTRAQREVPPLITRFLGAARARAKTARRPASR